MFCDAHIHLQDDRFEGLPLGAILSELVQRGWQHLVVNGTEPADWPRVAMLAKAFPRFLIPSFGLHPWKLATAPHDWLETLVAQLEQQAGPVGIGEIGLDRWMQQPDPELQDTAFRAQLALATARNLPVTIHCLRAWGPLMDVLREVELPRRGFLIHSVGASPEIIEELVALGGYFSVSGPFADPRKTKYQAALQAIPLDRLLIETDAPDMVPPPTHTLALLKDSKHGKDICHPLNLMGTYVYVREFFDLSDEAVLMTVFENFDRFFLR